METAEESPSCYVGHVSAFLGVTDGGLHYLEKQGITHPTHEEGSGYRQYSADDLLFLNTWKLYKAGGLELSDIREAMADDPSQLTRRIEDVLARRRRELEETERNAAITTGHLERARSHPETRRERRPAFRYLDLNNPCFKKPANTGVGKDIAAIFKPWNDAQPLVCSGILYEVDSSGASAYRKCMLVEERDYAASGIRPSEYEVCFPARPDCLYVSCCYTKEAGQDESEADMAALETLDRIYRRQSGGLPIVGKVIGRLLHVQTCRDAVTYYAEYWIPSEEAS